MLPRAQLVDITPYEASKWLKLPLLLTSEEMRALLGILPSVYVPLSGVVSEEKEALTLSELQSLYDEYIAQIQRGSKRPLFDPRLVFAISTDFSDMRAIPVKEGLLVRILKPVIQVQPYTLHYSTHAEQFHEMTHSLDSFYWGLIFSYPQLFYNPQTQEVEKVAEQFPNTAYFKSLQRWARTHTVPTPFRIQGKVMYHSARIGKQWIQKVEDGCLSIQQK